MDRGGGGGGGGGCLVAMLHTLEEVWKKERWTRVSRSCGSGGNFSNGEGGGGVGGGGGGRGGSSRYRCGIGGRVRVMNIACVDPRGPTAAACLRCRLFRRKQRLLAFLTVSTSISFVLLFLHTHSVILPYNERGQLTAEKELPERSHYVKKDIPLLGEVKRGSVTRGHVFTPAVYRYRHYGRNLSRQKGVSTITTVKVESNDILRHYRSGSDIIHADYFQVQSRQKQKSFERKLNLLELRSYRGSPDGGEGEGRREGDVNGGADIVRGLYDDGDDGDDEVRRQIRDKEDNEVLRIPPRQYPGVAYPQDQVKPIEASRNTIQGLSGRPPEDPRRLALGGFEDDRGRGEGERETRGNKEREGEETKRDEEKGDRKEMGSVGASVGGSDNSGKDEEDEEEEDNEEEEEEFNEFIIVFDYKRPAYFPWRTTRDECANYATRFMVIGGAPLIAAVSFPGAGNTWLRYITEALTGIFTGSVYHDETLALRGFWGERDGFRQGTTIIQKTHSFPLLPEDMKDGIYNGNEFRFLVPNAPRKVVVLLRNPWESLLALRHYHTAGHTGFANMAFFRGPGWANFTSERAQLWVQLYTSWLSLPHTRVHVMHYEYLQHSLEKEAKRLIEFLGLPLDYGRLECLIRYPEGRFRRPKYPKHLQGYVFPSASSNILREGMGSIDSLLRQGGHQSLPTHLYTFTPPIEDTFGDMPRGGY